MLGTSKSVCVRYKTLEPKCRRSTFDLHNAVLLQLLLGQRLLIKKHAATTLCLPLLLGALRFGVAAYPRAPLSQPAVWPLDCRTVVAKPTIVANVA